MLFSLSRSRPFSACSKNHLSLNSTFRKFRRHRDRSYLIRASSERTRPMTEKEKVLTLNEKLLDAIDRSDYKTYSVLCSDDITCFEPESKGSLVEGMEFHKWFFDWRRKPSDDYVRKMNIVQPKVRELDETSHHIFVGADVRTRRCISDVHPIGSEERWRCICNSEVRGNAYLADHRWCMDECSLP